MRKLTYEQYLENVKDSDESRANIARLVNSIADPSADPETIDTVIDLLCASYMVLGLCGATGDIANMMRIALGKTDLPGETCIPIARKYGDVGKYHALGIDEFRFPINAIMVESINAQEKRPS